MEDVVSHFRKLNGATGWGEWEVDQVELLDFLSDPDVPEVQPLFLIFFWTHVYLGFNLFLNFFIGPRCT